MLDLDNLTDTPKGKIDDQEISGLPAVSNRSIADVYDEWTKLILVLDDSGSMDQLLMSATQIMDFDFADEHWKLIANRIENAKTRLQAEVQTALQELDEEAEGLESVGFQAECLSAGSMRIPYDIPNEKETHDQFWAGLAGKTREAQKAAILKRRYHTEIGLPFTPLQPQKIEALKRVSKAVIRDRHDRYETPDVQVLKFESKVTHLRAVGKEELCEAIDSLCARGYSTRIYPAVETAVDLCAKAPSAVGCHHIVLATDGLDPDGKGVVTLVGQMKKLNIVLDFILIADQSEIVDDWSCAQALRDACAATGGQYTVVDNLRDFETIFLERAARLCLPPVPEE